MLDRVIYNRSPSVEIGYYNILLGREFDVVAVGSFLAEGIRQAIEDGDMGREYTEYVIETYHKMLNMIEGETEPAADALREIIHTELEWIDKNA